MASDMPPSMPHFYGWIVVACSFMLHTMTLGVVYSYGVRLKMWEDESRTLHPCQTLVLFMCVMCII